MEQPQYSLDEEPEKETVSLAPAQSHAEQNNEVIYGIIKTTVNIFQLTILVDSGAASSHITEKAVKDTKSPTHPTKKALQVVCFGNVESKIIKPFTIYDTIIYDDYPHLAQHGCNLSASIPRTDQGVDCIIRLRDISKIFPKEQDKGENALTYVI